MKAAILLAFAVLNLAAQVGFTPPSTEAQTTGKASIEGTVVDSLSGQPVRKATVMLNGGAGVALNAVTDTSGHFAFRMLPAGQYTVQASNDNYPGPRNPLQMVRSRFTITLAEDEQKQDVNLKLVPGGSVSGRITDEDDNPMRGCSVMAMQARASVGVDTGQSDDKGEYRMTKLPRGKYYILARCMQSVPLPHAFVLRSAISDLPTLVYPSRFYPGVADLAAAAKIEVAPGANVAGINLKMTPANGFTVRGHAAGLLGGGISQVVLEARDPSIRQESQLTGQNPRSRINGQTGEFEIRNVLPGSYDLLASSSLENRLYFARVPVEVGAVRPNPINIELAEAPPVSGTISNDGDATPPNSGLTVRLSPLNPQPMVGLRRIVNSQSDGSFKFPSVMPGHWRLNVDGATYLKSVTMGDQQVSANDLEIGASAVSLKIVLGTKFGQIVATSSESTSSSEAVYGFLWPADVSSGTRTFTINRQPVSNLPPGKYFGCAIATSQPAFLLNDYSLREALESHCASTELAEGGHATIEMPLISGTELEQLIDKLEQ